MDEAQLVELPNGDVMANMRSNHFNAICDWQAHTQPYPPTAQLASRGISMTSWMWSQPRGCDRNGRRGYLRAHRVGTGAHLSGLHGLSHKRARRSCLLCESWEQDTPIDRRHPEERFRPRVVRGWGYAEDRVAGRVRLQLSHKHADGGDGWTSVGDRRPAV